MASSNPPPGAGRKLAQILGWNILGNEGPSLKGPCILGCGSSDACRVHIDSGIWHCFSCDGKGNAWDFATTMAWSREEAKAAMVEAGLFDERGPSPKSGNDEPTKIEPAIKSDPIAEIAKSKGTTAEGFLAYGCKAAKSGGVKFPVWGPDGELCSGFWLPNGQDKGKFTKGQPAGLFWPLTRAESGEKWLMVEGVKDAAALWSLGYKNTVGLNTNRLNQKFCHLFQGVELTVVPDRDEPSEEGARHTARILAGHALSVRLARLPGELVKSHGQDVRDVLRQSGGPELVHRAIRMAVLLDSSGQPISRVEFPLLTGPELAAMKVELEALVEKVIYRHQLGVIGGPSKTLKTSCLVDLGVSLAVGRKFLGHFWVPERRRTALMSGETGIAALKNCYRRVCESKFVDWKSEPTAFFISESLPRLDSLAHLDAARQMIDAHELDVLLIDPMYLAVGAANSASLNEMGALLSAINEICDDTGCTLILAHHTVKRPGLTTNRSKYEPLEREDLHGSGIGEYCRQWILLNRRQPYEPNTPHEMNFCFGGSAGHSGNYGLTVDEGQFDPKQFGGLEKWEVTISPLAEARELDKLDAKKRKEQEGLVAAIDSLVAIVQSFDGPFSCRQTRDASRGQNVGRFFDPAWQALQDQAIIVPHTEKRLGRPLWTIPAPLQ